MAATGHVQSANMVGAVKSEAVYGTDAFGGGLPTAADIKRFRKIEIVPVIEAKRDAVATATNTAERSVMIPKGSKVSWEIPMFPANIATGATSHVLEALLNSSGLKSVIDDDVDVTYSPYSANDMTNTPSATFIKYEYDDTRKAKKLLARGVRSNPEFVLEQGAISYIKGEGMGLYDAEPDGFSAAPALPTNYNDDLDGLACVGLALKSDSDGVEWGIEKATIKANFTIKELMTGNGAGSVGCILLVKPPSGAPWTIDVTCAKGATAIADLIARMKSGTVIDFICSNSFGGRTGDFVIGAGQVRAYSKTADGIQKYQATIDAVRASGTAGDNDLEVIFA